MALSLLDKHLLDRAALGWSPVEIGQDTGLEPEVAYARIHELLGQRGLWDEIQSRQLLMHSVFVLKGRLEEWLVAEHFDKDKVNTYLSTLRLVSEALEKNAKVTEGQVELVVAAHKQYMLGVLSRLSVAAVDALHTKYPQISISEVDGIFTEVLAKERSEA